MAQQTYGNSGAVRQITIKVSAVKNPRSVAGKAKAKINNARMKSIKKI
jgi:hypothetical protein